MLKKTASIAILAALTLSAPAVRAEMIFLNKGVQGEGNKGASFRPWTDASHTATADFVITAQSLVDDTNPLLPGAAGQAGTVYVGKDGKNGKVRGLGVQTADGSGSKGISGRGAHGDEGLIFTYDAPVFLSSVSIQLGDIDFGHGSDHKDDPVIFLQTAGSSVFDVVLTETDIVAAFSYIGDPKNKHGQVDFGSFIATTNLGPDTGLAAFAVRETNDHIYVYGTGSGGEVVVPEPATMALLVSGSVVLVRRRRRNRV